MNASVTEHPTPRPVATVSVPSRRRLAFGLVIGIAVSGVLGFLAVDGISLSSVRTALVDAHYGWLVPALLLVAVNALLRAARWRALFSHPERIGWWSSLGALNIGLMANNVLPARLGEMIRMLALSRAERVSVVEVGTTLIVERILDVFVLAIIGMCLWPWLPDVFWAQILFALCAGIFAAGSVLFVGLALFRRQCAAFLMRSLVALPLVSEARAQSVGAAVRAGSVMLLRPRRLSRALLLTIAVWASVGLSIWSLLPAFDISLGLSAALVALVVNSFALVLPSSPAAVGVYEASVLAALVAHGVPETAALSFALVLHAINFFPLFISGGLALWLMGLKDAQLLSTLRPVGRAAKPHAGALRP